jgi:ribosomal protein L7/L12
MTWYWVAGIAVVVVLGVLSRQGERPESSSRPSGAPPTEAQIDYYLRAGRKIEAIKLYRTLHHVDLKAAKDAIDARTPGKPHDQS